MSQFLYGRYCPILHLPLVLALLAGLFCFEQVFAQTRTVRHFRFSSDEVNADLLKSAANQDADIILTKVPRGMFLDGDADDTETITWDSDISCILRFDTKPGNRDLENNYPNTASTKGTGSLSLTPFDEGMRTGVYYCILVSEEEPTQTSVEFRVIIEATSAATTIEPRGAVSLQQGPPLFRWNPVVGVPYYLVFLSEGQIKIERDDSGKITGLTGLNLTWFAMTTGSFLSYGDPDPSGNFVNAYVPPLLEGVTYNWVALNSYSPRPDLISTKVAPAVPTEFTVSRPNRLPTAPTPTFPGEEANVSDDEVTFSWASVSGAKRYRLFLYQPGEFDGNIVQFVAWSQVTTATQIAVDARNLFIRGPYMWRVVAEAGTRISASDVQHFNYVGAAGWARFTTSAEDGPVGRVSMEIRNEADTRIVAPTVTDTLGVSVIPLPAGDYSYTAFRPDFQITRRETFIVSPGGTTDVAVEMTRGPNTASGRVVDLNGEGVFDAIVEITASGETQSIRTEDGGYFSVALAAGSYSFQARKTGYVASAASTVSVAIGKAVDLGELTLPTASNTVRGQLVFTSDSSPLRGAYVRAENGEIVYETTSNSQGAYQFKLGLGHWRIGLDTQGFVASPPEYNLSLTENEDRSAPFQLVDGGLIYGKVSFQNQGLQGAQVRAFNGATGNLAQVATSNFQGNYSLGLPGGSYELLVTRENFQQVRQTVEITSGETLVMNFGLTEAGFVEGKVRKDDFTPAVGARVFVVGDSTIFALTDANGDYRLSLPPDTTFQIDVSFQGFSNPGGPLSVAVSSGEVNSGNDFLLRALFGILQVRVTNGFAPVAEALVTIPELEREEETRSDGRFEFEIPPGNYTITASKECHFTSTIFVALGAGDVQEVTLVLQPLESGVSGTVRDNFGQPISDAKITAVADTNFITFSVEDGSYELCLNSGIFRITVSKVGYFSSSAQIVVNEGDFFTDVDFTLQESFARVQGIVRNLSGTGVANAVVELENESQTLTDTTDQAGNYELRRVIPGQSQIQARLAGFYGVPQDIFLRERQQLTLNLTLYEANGSISGVVRSASDSSALAAVQVRAIFSQGGDDIFQAQTNGLGAYTINNLPVVPNSSFEVLAFRNGYLAPAGLWPAVPVNSTDIDFYMQPLAGAIAGIVRDLDTDKPLEAVRVEATATDPGSGSRSISMTSSDGKFQLLQLVAGKFYNLTATREGFFQQVLPNVSAGDTSVVIPLLRKYAFVRGRISDARTGRGLSNVLVRAGPEGNGTQEEVRSNRSGNYEIKLIPGSYLIEPLLSHYRSQPADSLLDLAEADTVDGVNFRLTAQNVRTLTIQRADLESRPTISNLETHCYIVDARDATGQRVNIGTPRWHLNVSPAAAQIDKDGCIEFDPAYFGELTISVEDPESDVSAQLQVTVFAPIDSTSNITLFDDRGLELQVTSNTVATGKEMQVTRQALAPAKKARAIYLTTEYSHMLKPTALTFDKKVLLRLPPPPNTEGQERHIARWNDIQNEWDLFEEDDQGSFLQAKIEKTGEYVALAISRPLSIENFKLLPNPFSPYQIINGQPGLAISFDISSSVAPTPLLTVKIYNLEGNLVRLLHEQTPFQRGQTTINWDGRTDNGTLARNGRYLVRVILEDPADKQDEMKSVVLIK